MRPGVTPVPMPNTTVKTRTADGTALETVRESRWPPEHVFLIEQRSCEVRKTVVLPEGQNYIKELPGRNSCRGHAAKAAEELRRTLKTAYTKKASK